MIINNQNSFKALIFAMIILLGGVVITLAVHSCMMYQTRATLKKVSPERSRFVARGEERKPVPYTPVEKAAPAGIEEGSMEGYLPPVNPDAPPVSKSIKSNEVIENLLFAMKYYGQVPADQAMTGSTLGWDGETGYYLPVVNEPGAEIYALTRNVRYLLILKFYQDAYPTTKYFDDDAVRISGYVDRTIEKSNLEKIITAETFQSYIFPHKLFYDLLELSKITRNPEYRDAALYIGKTHSFIIQMQANQIKSNKSRSDKAVMFNDAAMTYVYGKEMGKIDLMKDAELVINELAEKLWDENFMLLYTNATTGVGDNLTTTFIAINQMEALLNIVHYLEVVEDKEVEAIARTMLMSFIEGTNPLCDQQRGGFFRRYAGENRSPVEDFKKSLDHTTYLYALVRMNILKKGEFNDILNLEYENYSYFLYRDTSNAIFLEYDMTWNPFPHAPQNRPVVSIDAVEDFLLLTLEDRIFRAEMKIGSS
jgi:hypothetical protein